MKEYFNSTIVYYLRHLSENGCPDPVREVVSNFTEYMNNHITKEQKEYIEKNIKSSSQNKTLEDVLILVKTMRVSKKYDEQSLKLIEEGLSSLL